LFFEKGVWIGVTFATIVDELSKRIQSERHSVATILPFLAWRISSPRAMFRILQENDDLPNSQHISSTILRVRTKTKKMKGKQTQNNSLFSLLSLFLQRQTTYHKI
jgi:hypothetical protein